MTATNSHHRFSMNSFVQPSRRGLYDFSNIEPRRKGDWSPFFIDRAADVLGVTVADLKSGCKKAIPTRQRQAIAWVMHKGRGVSVEAVSNILCVHRVTVDGYIAAARRKLTDPEFSNMVDALEAVA